MVHKIYLALISTLLSINSIQGTVDHANCGLWVRNGKIELRCDCTDGQVPVGWLCRPTDVSCPNGYFDYFENRCKCIEYEDESDTHSECKNLCGDSCENGICLGSGKCSCTKEGYAMSNKNICEPICDGGCEHGKCVAPNKCECHPGYALNGNNKCDPICEYECENGYCLLPNWCACNDGFLRQEKNICKPKDDSYYDYLLLKSICDGSPDCDNI